MKLLLPKILSCLFFIVLPVSLHAAGQPATVRVDYYHGGSADFEMFSLHQVVLEPLPWPGHPDKMLDTTERGHFLFQVEDPESGFTSIPQSIYWAIVTLTTVGYGDISPQTGIGRTLAAIIMIIGYGIIAVPTGIVTAELTQSYKKGVSTQACPQCSAEGHDPDAKHCKYCGAGL